MLCSLFALYLVLTAGGQTSPNNRPAGELGDRYVDGTYGFAICPPKDWNLVRRREAEPNGEVVLRMHTAPQPAGHVAAGDGGATGPHAEATPIHEIRVRHVTRRQDTNVADMLKGIAFQVEFEHPDANVESRQEQDIARRPGGMLSASFTVFDESVTTISAVVEMSPRSFLVIQSTSPTKARSMTEPLFVRVLESLEILAGPGDQRKLSDALSAGAEWQKSLNAERLIGALPNEEYYVFELDGKPIGLSRLDAGPVQYRRFTGYELYEETWLFDVPGITRRIQTKLFIRDDLKYERYQRSSTAWIQPSVDGPERLENDYEDQLRDRSVLLTGQTHTIDVPLEQNPALDVDEKYLSPMLVRLFPRLLGNLEKQQTLAFLSFDHVRRGFIVRVFECAGQTDPPPGVAIAKCYKILDREGFADAAVAYVNRNGQVIHAQAGSLLMKPAKRDELEKIFGRRVIDAGEAITRLEKEYEQYWRGHARSLRRGRR